MTHVIATFWFNKVKAKVKIKFTLKQATKAQMGVEV